MPENQKKIELRSEEFQEVLGDTPSWILRWGVTLLAIIVVLFLIASSIFKYPDIISSRMLLTGTIPAAAVVSKTTGKLQEVNVKDNQLVGKGDYLAVIENPAKTSDVISLKKNLIKSMQDTESIYSFPQKELSLGNMQGLYSSFYIVLSDYFQFKQQGYYLKKIELMKNRIKRNHMYYNNMLRQRSIIGQQLQLTKVKYLRDSILNKKRVVANEEFENSHNQFLQGELSKEIIESSLENLQLQISQMQETLLDLENQYEEKKNTLETQIKTYVTKLLTDIQTWEMTNVIIAPISGKITFTDFWVNNQNVTVNEEIFNIVPTEKVQIFGKANLPIIRSGKVKVGQKVNIKFDNFLDSEFGIVHGIVQNISLVPSKIDNKREYIIKIELPNGLTTSYNKILPYLPEMAAQADIITEDLSLLERLFMPIRKLVKERM